MPTFLIVGATGKQGGKAISTLLDQADPNLSLRFITRNPTSPASQALEARGAKPIKADLSDKASLKSALEGVDRAFLVTDAMAGEEGEAAQGRTFIDAAKEAGVKHVVFTSVSSADTAVTVPHFRSKYEVEKHLAASGLTYTILRPVAFMENFPIQGGLARFMIIGLFFSMAGSKPVAFISTTDIGYFAAQALLKPTDPVYANRRIDLAAGEYNIDDVSKAVERAQGYVPWFARYAPKAVRNLLPHDFKEMMKFFEETGYPAINVDQLREIYPDLTDFEKYFKESK